MRKFCLLLVLLIWSPTFAKSDLPPGVQQFLGQMVSERIPLPGRESLFNHYYRTPQIESRAVVFLPGMGEPAIKYYDLVNDLQGLGATLYFWDHLGQGLSYHFIPNEIHKVYIDSFESHLTALENFLNTLNRRHEQILVIGHSMGGHLAVMLAQKRPRLIDKLVLSAPMIDINRKTLPLQWVAWAFNAIPGTFYPPLVYLFKKGSDDGNWVTNSEERMRMYKQTYEAMPELKRDGATVGWILSALDSIRDMRKKNFVETKLPILMLQAEEDFLVSVPAQSDFCKKLPNCKSQVIAGSRHEILFEKDPARQNAINHIRDFFKPDATAADLSRTAQ